MSDELEKKYATSSFKSTAISKYTWLKCDICGKWHRENYGFKYRYDSMNINCVPRAISMCSSCARKYGDKIVEDIESAIRQAKQNEPKFDFSSDPKQKAIEESHKHFWDSFNVLQ